MQIKKKKKPLLKGDGAFDTLYIYKSVEPQEPKGRSRQICVGTVQIAPPFGPSGRPWPRPLDRISIKLRTEATRTEISDIKRLAIERIPILDRIWFLRNIAQTAENLQRLSLLLPKLGTLPENCRDLDLTEHFWGIAEQWARLSDPEDEPFEDPGLQAAVEKARRIPQFPGSQMLWAFTDAGATPPALIRSQVLNEPEDGKWCGRKPLTSEELGKLVTASE